MICDGRSKRRVSGGNMKKTESFWVEHEKGGGRRGYMEVVFISGNYIPQENHLKYKYKWYQKLLFYTRFVYSLKRHQSPHRVTNGPDLRSGSGQGTFSCRGLHPEVAPFQWWWRTARLRQAKCVSSVQLKPPSHLNFEMVCWCKEGHNTEMLDSDCYQNSKSARRLRNSNSKGDCQAVKEAQYYP